MSQLIKNEFRLFKQQNLVSVTAFQFFGKMKKCSKNSDFGKKEMALLKKCYDCLHLSKVHNKKKAQAKKILFGIQCGTYAGAEF